SPLFPYTTLFRSRRERRRDELADARVIRRLDEEQAPALDVPELLPARIERLGVELVLASDVSEVATEPAVAQAGAHLRVPGDEVAAEALVVVNRGRFAQRCELRVRIGDEGRVGRVEGEGGHGYPRKLVARLQTGAACETRR